MTKASDPTQDFFEKFPKETLFRIFLNQVDCCVCFKDRSHRYMLCSSSFSDPDPLTLGSGSGERNSLSSVRPPCGGGHPPV